MYMYLIALTTVQCVACTENMDLAYFGKFQNLSRKHVKKAAQIIYHNVGFIQGDTSVVHVDLFVLCLGV